MDQQHVILGKVSSRNYSNITDMQTKYLRPVKVSIIARFNLSLKGSYVWPLRKVNNLIIVLKTKLLCAQEMKAKENRFGKKDILLS